MSIPTRPDIQPTATIAAVVDHAAVARTRRKRGYNLEYELVNKFNKLPDWHARRLGGSSTGLPDIVAVNNEKDILYTIEAKSGTSGILYVPPDQIKRCNDVLHMFSRYETKRIILAFKFSQKKRVIRKKQRDYEYRPLKIYYAYIGTFDPKLKLENYPSVAFNYNGQLAFIRETKDPNVQYVKEVWPPEYWNIKMPWEGVDETGITAIVD